uniref:hypothetical protein n=1 Tax=Goniotrichopsis reniformis TaxID=468933 RepID=UPI001FCCC8E3|nr:hypothetical protein MW428_pgp154 [Goniotrichopsis reniformis]UNJ14744.1 hypothetical protein [Goniotrichopsis reniformis]
MTQEIDTTLQTLLQKIDFQSNDITSNQMDLINSIIAYNPSGHEELTKILYRHAQNQSILPIDGVIYDKLLKIQDLELQQFLIKNFPSGLIPLNSEKNIDYTHLQKLLEEKRFLEADKLTQKKLCELAEIKSNRDWLYFTDIINLPITDLQTIDTLWRIHSQNRFGFSIQKQIWNTVQENREKLFLKIQWLVNQNLCRYPKEFIWDLSAPKGHLPLFNQLRGTQALIYLLSHKAWQS